MDLHDQLKMLKHGYSKVTDHVCREIRHRRLTRAQGQALVCAYEGEGLQYADKFCEWLGIDRRGLEFIMNQHRNPNVWELEKLGHWVRSAPKMQSNLNEQTILKSLEFKTMSELANGELDRYVVIGKGHPP